MNKRDSNLKSKVRPGSFLHLPIFYAAVQLGAHRSRFFALRKFDALKSNRDHRQACGSGGTWSLAKTCGLGVKMVRLLFLGMVLTCADVLLGQAGGRPWASAKVTITPAKVTLFAGESQTFVASVVGVGDKSVNWAVGEEDGGTITDRGQYTAPKIQGVYHVTATSRGNPGIKAIAAVTVLTYCDPLPAAFRQ